jgi:acetylornithine/N-succinyldiaminopimelate aminotransferase
MASHNRSSDIIAIADQYMMKTYRPLPLVIESGEGARIVDADGKRYIDFVAGIAVASVGYGNKALASAIKAQVDKVLHTSNQAWNEPAVLLAQLLCQQSFADRVFFCNSGAEANEAMIKLARRAFYKTDPERTEIICMDKAFHGRTLGTISATGQAKYRDGFGPLLPGFKAVPFGDVEAVKAAMTPKTAAIMLEPILGEGGVAVAPKGYLRALRDLCDETGTLLLFDEVQTGIGRTGKLFAYMHEGVEPDAMALAKGLGGGMPIGALLCLEKWGNVLEFPTHGSTFGCNPVACAAGLEVMRQILEPAFLTHVNSLSSHLEERLRGLQSKFGHLIANVRGRGLFFGLEFKKDPAILREKALEKGLLINFCGHWVLRVAPPLVIDRATLDEGLDIFTELLLQSDHG